MLYVLDNTTYKDIFALKIKLATFVALNLT